MLCCRLDESLNSVWGKATSEAQDDLASDQAALVLATRCASEVHENPHTNHENANTGDCKPLDVADVTDNKAYHKSC